MNEENHTLDTIFTAIERGADDNAKHLLGILKAHVGGMANHCQLLTTTLSRIILIDPRGISDETKLHESVLDITRKNEAAIRETLAAIGYQLPPSMTGGENEAGECSQPDGVQEQAESK